MKRFNLVPLTALFGAGIIAVMLIGSAVALDPPHDVNPITSGPMNCTDCHNLHGAAYPGLLGFVCERCHFAANPWGVPVVDTHSSRTIADPNPAYGDWDLDCWACHDPHTQQQERYFSIFDGLFIRRNIRAQIKEINPADSGDPGDDYWFPISTMRWVYSSEVEYSQAAGNFTDTDAPENADDDICRVCHENTTNFSRTANNHDGNAAGSANPGDNCVTCHPHDSGFAAAGGGCTGCHGQPQPSVGQYRRDVASATGDFSRTSHHVNGSVTDDDCSVCHDQSSHQDNNPTNPGVVLLDPDGGASHTYTGSGSELEPFCLGCHDSDGGSAVGTFPTDGVAPPVIATDWVGSQHDTGISDGCVGCHGGTDSTESPDPNHNAHGSNLTFLGSEVVAGEAVSTPEGLCLSCHDDDGPASTDIEAEFSFFCDPAIGSDPSQDSYCKPTGGDDAQLNTHHDIYAFDTTYSGARIACTDCHSAHAAALVPDPDPNDGSTPTAGTLCDDGSGPGFSLMTEWCSDCHDNSFPTTLTPPTAALIDVASPFHDDRGDQHGCGDGGKNVGLGPRTGFARYEVLECDRCHNLGHGTTYNGVVYPNLANLRAVLYAADNVTILVPNDVDGDGVVDDPARYSWDPANPEIVRVLQVESSNTDYRTNGAAWCSSCHPDPMGGNKSGGCLAGGCHHHGLGSF